MKKTIINWFIGWLCISHKVKSLNIVLPKKTGKYNTF